MGLRIPRHMEVYRRKLPGSGGAGNHANGMFEIPSRGLRIVISDGGDWDHVSVSRQERCPTWEEMEWVKREFFEPGDCCMQLHVPTAEHRNNHPFCLHIWRPHHAAIPMPPLFMV